MALKYLGSDPRTDWIPGIPARDLTDEDLAELGAEVAARLANSRLYEQAAKAAPKGDN
jgi:hypothetical protein